MHTKAIPIVIAALFASAVFGQDASRIFNFASTDTVQDIQEVATLIKVMGDIQQVTTDNEQKSLAVRGTAGQIALAEWLFGELDKPANRPPLAQQSPDPATHEYRVQGGNEDVVRVFYPKRTATLQDFQEVATLVRSIADIRRVFTYNEPRALVMRGTADQAALAEWLVNTLNTAQPNDASAKLEYKIPGGSEDVVRVFYLAHTDTLQSLQEVATVVRSIADIRRLFTYNAPKAIAMRGTADQAALAEWLFSELDKLVKDKAAHEYRMSGTAEDVVRVFYLPHSGTVRQFQEIATFVRSTTHIRRAFTYNAPRALTLRGTADQIAQASQLIQERDKP
jgi:hypothetical protein